MDSNESKGTPEPHQFKVMEPFGMTHSIVFYDNRKERIGRLHWEQGKMDFEGEATKSGSIFLEALVGADAQRMQNEFEKGRMSQFKESNQLGPVEMKRDQHGFWSHPDIPWGFFGEDINFDTLFGAMGFDCVYTQADGEVDDEELEKMTENLDFNAWVPKPPSVDSSEWFIISISDTDVGIVATWLRKQP
jgi:hypothetical protein